MVVSKLEDPLSHEVYENDFDLFENCFRLIWNCAQNLSYPDFYQAWHFGTNKPATVDLSRLPQQLRSALPDTICLVCIDASQFLDDDNPTAEIYDTMLAENYPESDSIPENLQQFKLYWNKARREFAKRDTVPVLLFYENPQPPNPVASVPTFSICCRALMVKLPLSATSIMHPCPASIPNNRI